MDPDTPYGYFAGIETAGEFCARNGKDISELKPFDLSCKNMWGIPNLYLALKREFEGEETDYQLRVRSILLSRQIWEDSKEDQFYYKDEVEKVLRMLDSEVSEVPETLNDFDEMLNWPTEHLYLQSYIDLKQQQEAYEDNKLETAEVSIIYECPKCHEKKASIDRTQTRASDEAITIRCECLVCGAKFWR